MVVVHAANIQDREGAKLVLEKVRGCFTRLKLIWMDGGYAAQLIEWVKTRCGWILEIVKRSDEIKGFQVLPRRWVVERTFGSDHSVYFVKTRQPEKQLWNCGVLRREMKLEKLKVSLNHIPSRRASLALLCLATLITAACYSAQRAEKRQTGETLAQATLHAPATATAPSAVPTAAQPAQAAAAKLRQTELTYTDRMAWRKVLNWPDDCEQSFELFLFISAYGSVVGGNKSIVRIVHALGGCVRCDDLDALCLKVVIEGKGEWDLFDLDNFEA